MRSGFSKKVVAGAIAPVLVAGMMPAMAFADNTDEANGTALVAATIADSSYDETALSAQADASTTFTFSDSGITASGETSGYEIDGTTLTIKKAGTYLVTGSCADGCIEVKKGTSDVHLILQDLTLAKDANKAIKFKAGSSGTIEIRGTNALSTTNDKGIIKANAEADDNDNIVYAADGTTTGGDLVLCGTGTLALSSTYTAVVDGETEDCDAVNCEGDLTVLSGTYNINVTDDGMHADNTLTIGSQGAAGPTIDVANSTEGLEGATVNLLSGTGNVVASDDGVNAANADLETYNWPYAINIAGGTWTIDAQGDGLDSNGDILVSGGSTVVYGATQGGNGVFDIGDGGGCVFEVTGGTLFGMGTSDMAITPTSGTYVVFGGNSMGGGMPGGMGGPGGGFPGGMGAMSSGETPVDEGAGLSAQAFPGMTGSAVSVSAGQSVVVKDSSGGVVASTVAAKTAQWVMYASSDLQQGQTYTLYGNGSQLATASAMGGTSGASTSNGDAGVQPGQPNQPTQPNQPSQPAQPAQTEEASQQTTESGIQDTSTSSQMYRLYNPNSGEHFYTANLAEKDNLVNVGWRYEGIAWNAPSSGDEVYRLYNPNAGDHHYTASAAERDHLVSVGWRYEGVGWYSDPSQGQALYRLYNPNAVAGAHHYTTSAAERDHLVSVGWSAEGIGWYGASA